MKGRLNWNSQGGDRMRISQCREMGSARGAGMAGASGTQRAMGGKRMSLDYQDTGIRGVLGPEPSPLVWALV